MRDCILPGFLVMIGLTVARRAVMTGFSWRSAESWPRVQALLKNSAIEKRRNVIGPPLILDQYRPSLKYAYQFAGRSYEGGRMTFWDRRLWDYDREKAEKRLTRLGNEFFVAVSPKRPHKAVIEYKLTSRELDFLGVLGVTGVLVGGVGAWVVWMMCPW